MWHILQHHEADDSVIATGEAYSVREFCDVAFEHAGLDWEEHVVVDPRYFRPAEVDYLVGDPPPSRPSCSAGPREPASTSSSR